MKAVFCFAITLLLTIPAFSQQPDWQDRKQAMERVHAIKVAYITDRLHLSSDQSQEFWPLYSAYEKELITLRRSYFDKYKKLDKGDDEVSKRRFDDDLDFQSAKLDLKRKYKDQFLKILSPQQLADLFKAESEFNMRLVQRLKNGGGGDGKWRDHDDR